MKLYIASDHAGFEDKGWLVGKLQASHELVDLGPTKLEPDDDYPIFAQKLGEAVVAEPDSFGILLCRSGEGMVMAVNKIDGVRGALVWNEAIARETRADNNSNVVVLSTGEIDQNMMLKIVETFVNAEFSGEARHQRRIEQIRAIEQGKELS